MFIDRLEFQLCSGTRQVYGKSAGGVDFETFRLDVDEAIVEVTHVETHNYLAQKFIFKTDKGSIFEISGWGGPGKEPRQHKIVAPQDQQICGLVFQEEKTLQGIYVQSRFRRGSRQYPRKVMRDLAEGHEAAKSK
ncbi:unnamed protein product [Symbiodinium pilosum]|uniref:Jacalin-type lectin domain-containing protein n=1 Tax=Symbiodinium pilosum TaxID=2952 RepID=A0A812UD26_SYMPI|nr:unnamed protein product [Symbiodinium pilosum]